MTDNKEQEWLKLKENLPEAVDPKRPYAGILNGPYKFHGRGRCKDRDQYEFQCVEPFYGNKELCYYHRKIKQGLIEPEKMHR